MHLWTISSQMSYFWCKTSSSSLIRLRIRLLRIVWSQRTISLPTILRSNLLYNYTSFTDSRYDDRDFKNLLINLDAARKSTEKMRQFKTLQRIDYVKLNKSNRHTFKFETENISSVESINLETSLETITFHIVEINISFLLFLADLDRLSVYFNNLTNELIQNSSTNILQIDMKNDRYSVIKRYEHVFLLWKILIDSLIVEFLDENSCFLIKIELRRLHRRFDHFSTRRLHQILDRAEYDHEMKVRVIEHLIKYYHHC